MKKDPWHMSTYKKCTTTKGFWCRPNSSGNGGTPWLEEKHQLWTNWNLNNASILPLCELFSKFKGLFPDFSIIFLKGPCNSASGFVLYQYAIKSIQNNQNLKFSADPSHKIWEKHFQFGLKSLNSHCFEYKYCSLMIIADD